MLHEQSARLIPGIQPSHIPQLIDLNEEHSLAITFILNSSLFINSIKYTIHYSSYQLSACVEGELVLYVEK